MEEAQETHVSVEEHKVGAPTHLSCAVITASNTRTEATDDSGQYVRGALKEAGHLIAYYVVVKDDPEAIRGALESALGVASVVVVNGGTGLSPTDVTIETLAPLFDKRIDGFGEAFRWLSFQDIGSAAIMSRATAGVIDAAFVACLPGSPKAVRLAMKELILPELGHIMQQITVDSRGHH